MSWLKLAVLVAGYIMVPLGIQEVPWDARGWSVTGADGTVVTVVEPGLDALSLSRLASGEMDAIALTQLTEFANRARVDSDAIEPKNAPVDPVSQRIADMLSGRGSGLLRVLDNGEIVIALSLDETAQSADVAVLGKFFRLAPVLAVDALLIPSPYWGEFEVSYQPATRTLRIVANEAETLFLLTVEELSNGDTVLVDEDGVPVIAGVQIACCQFGRAWLAEVLGEATVGEDPVVWADWLIALYEAKPKGGTGASDDNPCENCSAGGPGSSSSSVSGCSGEPEGCVVVCKDGKYACCQCLGTGDDATCVCCQEPIW